MKFINTLRRKYFPDQKCKWLEQHCKDNIINLDETTSEEENSDFDKIKKETDTSFEKKIENKEKYEQVIIESKQQDKYTYTTYDADLNQSETSVVEMTDISQQNINQK